MYHIFSLVIIANDYSYKKFVDIENYVPQIGSTLKVHENLPWVKVDEVGFESEISTLRVFTSIDRNFYGSEIETFENEGWEIL